MTRRNIFALVIFSLAIPTTAPAETATLSPADRDQLLAYARDTWRSLEAVTSPSGLPADGLRRGPGNWTPAEYTSPSDIAAYLWSTLAVADLRLIDRDEANRRLAETLAAVARLERAHGFFFNWYDPRTGHALHAWPGGGSVRPFLSVVDNGWLAAALMMVGNAHPELRSETDALLAPMDFGFFYNAYEPTDPVAHPGLLHGGFWTDTNTFTEFHYGMLNTEPRIASYVGIARGNLPHDHYYRMSRSGRNPLPDSSASTRIYEAVPVVEGSQLYRDVRIVPSWDGTAFEALMVPLFVPEAAWAPRSWGINHPLYVRAQIEHGLQEARVGYWGVSASCDPDDGYRPFGIAALGASPESTGNGEVVTPHASFLALAFAPHEALANLRGLATTFPTYTPYGFLDAVNVVSGRVSDRVLTLDQGMILASIDNILNQGSLQHAFCAGLIETTIPKLIAPEHFNAGIVTSGPVVREANRMRSGLMVGLLSDLFPPPSDRREAGEPTPPRPTFLSRKPFFFRETVGPTDLVGD